LLIGDPLNAGRYELIVQNPRLVVISGPFRSSWIGPQLAQKLNLLGQKLEACVPEGRGLMSFVFRFGVGHGRSCVPAGGRARESLAVLLSGAGRWGGSVRQMPKQARGQPVHTAKRTSFHHGSAARACVRRPKTYKLSLLVQLRIAGGIARTGC
jgi:hypothetical protein